ncbi:MAG: GNAT family N-acetyltransferase [Jatrophihabitantaceae bacterium]
MLGLARTISDGETICYVQDVLVRPDRQRREIGRRLMQRLRDDYRHCRQFLLTTDGADDTAHRFYRAVGLVPISEQGLVTFGAGS